jgi:hypothetical protein
VVPVIRLTGVLDTDDRHGVRSRCRLLAQQPEAVVVDVSDLGWPIPAATSILPGRRRETADWPAAHSCSAHRPRAVAQPPACRCGAARADAFADLGEPDARAS